VRRRWIAISLLLVEPLVPSPAGAQGRRTATPLDFVTLRVASDPQVSPDGRRVAFVVREPGDPRKPDKPGDTNIWIVPADGSDPPRPFAASPAMDASPVWSPDGKYLAFLSDRGAPLAEAQEARSQIYLLRADGGDAEALTTAPGGVEALRWANDGSAIAFTARDGPSEGDRKRDKEKDDRLYLDHEYKYARLFTVTLGDRKIHQITKQDVEVTDFAWSPDAAEFAVRVAPTPRLDDAFLKARLLVLQRESGEILRTLSESPGGNLEWSPDGQTIYFHDLSPQRIVELPAIVPAAGGGVRRMLDGYPGTLWAAKWLPDSKRLVGEAIEGTREYRVQIDVASGTVARGEEAWHGWVCGCRSFGRAGFSVSRDGATVAYLREAADAPADVWVSSTSGPPKRLTTLNPQVAELKLGAARELTWQNPKDGRRIFGVVIFPPDYRPGQLYPTVVQVHGGPEWAWWMGWHGSWHEWGQLLASNGYVVLLPNPRGSDGQGWRFAEANRVDWGGADFQDILAGVDALVAQKIADPERLGIGGWSYGGFMTSWAVSQTSRFKAAVVGAAVTDLFSMYGTTDIPTFLEKYFLGLPYRRRVAYDAHSPMALVQKVRTPALVLHGGADARVPPGQGMEFYQALKRLGVETEMVTYPREPHAFQERAHQLDLLTRVLAWYDRFLKQ
jgi:dipeptidyl aminopeptidase/acylaminoacyl peptidase